MLILDLQLESQVAHGDAEQKGQRTPDRELRAEVERARRRRRRYVGARAGAIDPELNDFVRNAGRDVRPDRRRVSRRVDEAARDDRPYRDQRPGDGIPDGHR